MFSLSIIIIIYNLHHILLPTLPSCLFTSNFPTLFSLTRYVSTVIQKRCYLRRISLPLMYMKDYKYTQPAAWDQF